MNSIELAKKLQVRHIAITRLIKKYNKYFIKLGPIRFEKVSGNGRPFMSCKLNTKQKNFAISLLKNTDDYVIKLKFEIVNKL